MVGSKERGKEVTSRDTMQLSNAQTRKPKKRYHAQKTEVRREGILRMRLMSRRDCRIATAITCAADAGVAQAFNLPNAVTFEECSLTIDRSGFYSSLKPGLSFITDRAHLIHQIDGCSQQKVRSFRLGK